MPSDRSSAPRHAEPSMLKVPSHLVLPITVGLLCVCLAVLAFWLLGNKTSSIRRALGGEQLGTVMEKDREGHEVRKSSRWDKQPLIPCMSMLFAFAAA